MRAAGARRLRMGAFVCLGAMFAALPSVLSAQTRQKPRLAQSDLAQQNLSHVAATVGQLVLIFHRDPGLMVELKRWIARDATEHGQIISDSDLTEEAIFDRLENDIAFRAVATELVQKYGFLQPTINPESPMAQEQAILVRERARYRAQDEELSRTRSQELQNRNLEQTNLCDATIEDCSRQNNNPRSIQQMPAVEPGTNNQAPGEAPSIPNAPSTIPNAPSHPGNSGTDVASLLRTSGQDTAIAEHAQASSEDGEDFSQYGPPGSAPPRQSKQQDLSLSSDFSGEALSPDLPDNSRSATRTGLDNLQISGATQPPYDGDGRSISKTRQSREALNPTQRMVRQRNPYEMIPSLYDMYLQAAARPPAVERFGMQIFENGTRNLEMIPMDLPVGPEYVVGPGDGISIDLWGSVARRFYRVVDRQGRISLPEVAPLMVAGKSLAEVQETVQKTLRTQFRDLSADVSLSRLRTVRIYVVGDVVRPGAYDVSSLSTPLNALFAAGGPTGRGSLRIVKHYRGNQLVEDVDVYDLLLHGV